MIRYISSDINFLNEKFFSNLLDIIYSLRKEQRIVIGLSGWNSLKTFYLFLKDNFSRINYDIAEKLFFCLLDERVVGYESEYNNFRFLSDLFLSELVADWFLNQNNILIPDFSESWYEKKYFENVRNIDIWLFWVWEDWHIGSLFPSHILLDSEESSYHYLDDSPKPPPQRITVSKNLIKWIWYNFVFFISESKRDSLKAFDDEDASYKTCPAKIILDSENIFLFSDIV